MPFFFSLVVWSCLGALAAAVNGSRVYMGTFGFRGAESDGAAAADGGDHWPGRPLLSSFFFVLECAFHYFETAGQRGGAKQVKRLCGLRSARSGSLSRFF
jgi:hypothetical protein